MASDNPHHRFADSVGETSLLLAEFDEGTPFEVYVHHQGDVLLAGEGESPEEALADVDGVLKPVDDHE